ALLGVASAAVVWLFAFVREQVSGDEIGWVFLLGALTALRIIVLIVIASLIWVPVGVWIGLRPQLAERVQPVVQFLAAFPANLVFPAVVVLILKFELNPEIWLSPLMILGTQWYILFNVIAGTTALPTELKLVASNLGLRRWLWWRRVIWPAIFPAYVTGAVTAAGGSWNASIVAEVVQWGNTTLQATGIGAYITEYTAAGWFSRTSTSPCMRVRSSRCSANPAPENRPFFASSPGYCRQAWGMSNTAANRSPGRCAASRWCSKALRCFPG